MSLLKIFYKFRYGFVSFKDPADFTRAIKELNGTTFVMFVTFNSI